MILEHSFLIEETIFFVSRSLSLFFTRFCLYLNKIIKLMLVTSDG